MKYYIKALKLLLRVWDKVASYLDTKQLFYWYKLYKYVEDKEYGHD